MNKWDYYHECKERYPEKEPYYCMKYAEMYARCVRWRNKFPDSWVEFIMDYNETTRSPGARQAIADFLYDPLI